MFTPVNPSFTTQSGIKGVKIIQVYFRDETETMLLQTV